MNKPTSVAGQRLLAFIIDSLVISAVVVVLWLILTDKVPKESVAPSSGGFDIGDKRWAFTEDSPGKRTLWAVLSLLAMIVVSIVLPGLKGTSPGRAAAGIRLVGAEGRPPGIGRALVRWVFWIADLFPWLVPLVGWIMVLATNHNQRVGDMVARTYTVKKEHAGDPAPAGSDVRWNASI